MTMWPFRCYRFLYFIDFCIPCIELTNYRPWSCLGEDTFHGCRENNMQSPVEIPEPVHVTCVIQRVNFLYSGILEKKFLSSLLAEDTNKILITGSCDLCIDYIRCDLSTFFQTIKNRIVSGGKFSDHTAITYQFSREMATINKNIYHYTYRSNWVFNQLPKH